MAEESASVESGFTSVKKTTDTPKLTPQKGTQCPTAAPVEQWRHYPWLAGLVLAPLLYGASQPEAQAAVGVLFALSLYLLRQQANPPGCAKTCHPKWGILAACVLIFPLIPLPADLVGLLSPERTALARAFPMDPEGPSSWTTLTLSPTGTVGRLVMVALVVTAFWLARLSAAQPGLGRLLVRTLALTVLLLALCDLWLELVGRPFLPGKWPDPGGAGAGPFRQANHFAGFIIVSALFLFGWILRQRWPVRLAHSRDPSVQQRDRREEIFLAVALGLGLVLAFRTGARAALFGLVVGAGVWTMFLTQRSPNRHRGLRMFGLAVIAFSLLAASSDYLLGRLANLGDDLVVKAALWKDSAGLITHFPWFGVGAGSFASAINHYKTFGGKYSFAHAENDLIELLVEQGLIGSVIIGILLGSLLVAAWRFAWRQVAYEPELVFGGLAAVIGFGTHSFFAFVFQVPANAILLAVLLGFVLGCRDRVTGPAPSPERSVVPFRVAWATVLILLACVQSAAFLFWHKGLHAQARAERIEYFDQSLRLWPWHTPRQLYAVREQIESTHPFTGPETWPPSLEGYQPVQDRFRKALRQDPFHWELRLERTWFDLAASGNHPLAVAEARDLVRLNPLQAQVPLRFAWHFEKSRPALAYEFLHAARLTSPRDFQTALTLAWRMDHDIDGLWELITGTPAGFQALVNFAMEENLDDVASEARWRLVNDRPVKATRPSAGP